MHIKKTFALILSSISTIFVVTIIAFGIAQWLEGRRVNRIWASLETDDSGETFRDEMVEDLPEIAQRYLLHAIAPGTPIASHVTANLSGSIRTSPDGDWMSFTGEEVLSDKKGFVWKANVRMGMIPLSGSDYYADTKGRVRFLLFGLIPVVNADGPDISKSALGRLAIESIWLPTTFLPQHGATWEFMDDNHAKVSFQIDGEPTELTLRVAEDGRLEEAIIQRYGGYTDSGEFEYIPFGTTIDEERTFGGYTIPTKMSAGWRYSTERYFEGIRFTIEDAAFGKSSN